MMKATMKLVYYASLKSLFVTGDFLENYCEEDDVANIIRFLIAILVITLYPLECHGARDVSIPISPIQMVRTMLQALLCNNVILNIAKTF